MLASNLLPLVLAVSVAVVSVRGGWLAAAGLLYLAPPLLTRLLFAVCGRPAGRHPVESRPFLVWWLSCQLQTLFLRLPFLEELLRFGGLRVARNKKRKGGL